MSEAGLMASVAAHYGKTYPHMRADLVWVKADSTGEIQLQVYGSCDADKLWVVKDTIAVKYYRLRHDERFILERLDGHQSASEIRDRYNAAFPPRRVTTAQVQQLILRFCREGLAVAASAEHYRTVLKKRQQTDTDRWRQFLIAWLFVRFPGFYANPMTSRLESFFKPCLGLTGLVAACFVIAISGLWLVTHGERFWIESSQLSRWATANGVLSLSIAIGLAKSLHELGHGIACRRFGGECHEIGVLLMCGIPCLYCDTSDAWLIRNRWQRQAVNLAGVFVELLVGTLAVAVWGITHTGFFHWLSLDLILVCLISSVLFNGNPLLRYDGYYVLADGLKVENLAIESRQRLNRCVRKLFWGEDRPVWPERSFAMQSILVVYAMLSLAYRCAILLGLAWLVIVACRAVGYERLGWQLAGAGSVTMAAVAWSKPAVEAWRRYRVSRWRRSSRSGMSLLRPFAIFTLFAGLSAVVFLYPMTQSLVVSGHVHRLDRSPVTCSVAGSLQSWREYGESVAEGDELVMLRNSEMEFELLRAQQEMHAQRALVESLERSKLSDPHLADQLPTARSLLESLVQQVDTAQSRVDRLVIRAPRSGEWVEPLRVERLRHEGQSASQRLGSWSGLLLDPKQQHCHVEEGAVIGWICAGQSARAMVLVDEGSIQWVRVGQQALVRLAVAPDQSFMAQVKAISLQPTGELTPRAAMNPGVIGAAEPVGEARHNSIGQASLGDSEISVETSRLRTVTKSYWVTLEIEPHAQQQITEVDRELWSMDGLDAQAIIDIGRQSIASRVWRWLSGQIRF